MGLQTAGRIHKIFDTEQKSERFRLREFVLELADNPQYPQFVKFQLTGDRCEQLDQFQEGAQVQVEFSLRGREWTSPKGEIRYFNSLDVWTLEAQEGGAPAGAAEGSSPPPVDEDATPF